MTDLATIEPRFKGPPQSGNGGYTCGILGSLIGESAEVTLKVPPPLNTPLSVEHEDGAAEWLLKDGDTVVATGHASPINLEVPGSVSFDEALAAEPAYSGHKWHLFPECFVCGPDRHEHDGLRLFPGPVEDRDVVATHWLPQQDVAGEFGAVSTRIVWAALDCPSYFGGTLAGYAQYAVLGRLTAKLLKPVEIGKRHVVIGWPIDSDDRKWHAGTAIYDAEGDLKAYARATWVVIPGDHSGFQPEPTT
jgi:hypothetical protein